MRVALRTTAGKSIGLGHLRRCLTLAAELQNGGDTVELLLAGEAQGLELAAAWGVPGRLVAPPLLAIEPLLDQVDVLVIDDYGVRGAEFAAMQQKLTQRPSPGLLLVVDDLADRPLAVDLVLNGNANADQLTYRVRSGTTMLLGARYSLLGPRFRALPKRTAQPALHRILVTLGGADPEGRTGAVTAELAGIFAQATLEVVLGPLFTDRAALEQLAAGSGGRIRLHRGLTDLGPLMAAADLAVSGGGQTTYELAAVGVPTVALCLADNQRGNLAALAQVPTLLVVGDRHKTVGAAAIRLAFDVALRQRLIDAGQALVDGRGALRVARELRRGLAHKQGAAHA